VIGGSSAINAMISMRGQAADYDHWRQLGLTGWGYDDVLPLFRRLEDHFLGESEHHGTGGGWRIEAPRLSWDILDAVGDAAEEMGIKRIADFNTGDNEGTSYFHVNQKRGRRWSSARGFLKPVLNRGNLRLEKNVLVDRLIIENGRAVGVRFMQGGEVVEARTKGEVILCAGSIGSTQVLHRSGIGPADWLSPLGIDVVLDRQGVGRNLQDHLQQRAIYKVFGVRTLNETYYNLLRRGMMGLDYAFRRRGPLTMAPSQLGIFTRSDPHRERANIQFHVQPLSLDKFGDPLHRFPAITVSACNLQPTSRGTVRLRSAKPDEAPSIAPNYLSTDDDRQVAADAIRTTRRLMKQKRLERYRPQEYLPGPSVGDDDASLAKAAGDIGTTIFHPVGTGKDGHRERSDGRGRRAVALSWHRGPARGGRFGDADDHVRQHQHADGDDRGERCGDDSGGCAIVVPMTNPKRISVGPVGEHIALARWGENGSGKPPALLLHGTGFVAEVWDEVARELASRYTVYALDRRGHGDSHKPAADRYHFQDFRRGCVSGDRGARPVGYIWYRPQRRRHRSPARGETFAQALFAPVRDGADRHGSTCGPHRRD
jgi:choline dehydrogenase-like flavoprotein